MPGLLRGLARTAMVAGTATAVSNRVSRRQAGRWAAEEAPPPQYAPQQQYAPPPQQYAPPPPPGGGGAQDVLDQLRQLGDLKSQGVLTEQEFEDQKRRILAGGPASGSEQVQRAGAAHGVAAAVGAELAVHRALVGLHRVDRDVELGGDLGVGQGARQVAQRDALPFGQRVDEPRSFPGSRRLSGQPAEQVQGELARRAALLRPPRQQA